MSRPTSPAEQARSRLAYLHTRKDATPAQIAQARADLEEAKLDAKVKEIVDRAPELTPAQYAELARALGVTPAGDPG